jgi:hypothetical protein
MGHLRLLMPLALAASLYLPWCINYILALVLPLSLSSHQPYCVYFNLAQ